MNEGRELWEKYCGFFDKSFSEQVAYNEKQKEELFEEWKGSNAAKHLCPDGVEKFEDIPLTTYDDYPILREFGQEIERLSERTPRGKEESLWDYYDRISRQVAPMLDGWLADEYGFCCKTSGTSGESKWFAHGQSFLNNVSRDIGALFAIACSNEWGKTSLKEGDRIFLVTSPAPYMGGTFYKSLDINHIEVIPPPKIVDNIPSMRKKLVIALKMIEKGERVNLAGGTASSFQMACRYFTNRPSLYKDYYQSMNFGIPKIVQFFMWLYQSLFGKRYKSIKELMDVKGMGGGGFDMKIYADYLREQFGREPMNGYGASECGFILFGTPDRKMDFIPDLKSGYLEFLDNDGEIRKITQLERDNVYELVVTPFGSVLVRYRMGDLLKVVDFRDNGMPVFSFESRKVDLLDIRSYFRLSEAVATNALLEAGLPPTDKWAFAKEIDHTTRDEYLCLLMEKEWEFSELEASRGVFDALRKLDPYFQNYVEDFGIRDPWQVIKVEYLKKGAFMRYIMQRAKQGAPMGRIKPLKLITPEKKEVADLLRSI